MTITTKGCTWTQSHNCDQAGTQADLKFAFSSLSKLPSAWKPGKLGQMFSESIQGNRRKLSWCFEHSVAGVLFRLEDHSRFDEPLDLQMEDHKELSLVASKHLESMQKCAFYGCECLLFGVSLCTF